MASHSILTIPSLNGKDYQIVFEKQKEVDILSKKDQKIFEDLYLKIQENPSQSIDTLIEFQAKYPQLPEAANLLTFAYLRLKKRKKAEALIAKTYEEHPEYLIARINYADQLLRFGKVEKVPKVFNQCFDLHRLYPEKESFHYSEFRGFMTLMGFYHLEIGNKERAEEYYQFAFQVDPLHPSVVALEKKLLKTSLLKKILRVLQKLAGISQNP